jgi:hypothetical protein
MKVKALVNCFVDNGYRREGEIFDCGSKFIPELMEPLEAWKGCDRSVGMIRA